MKDRPIFHNKIMQDAHSVITHAAEGHVKAIAEEMEVSLGRMYEILGKDNPYPKAKRLIRVIGKFNTFGVREIRADLNAMFDDILGGSEDRKVTAACVHKEAFEAVDAMLQGKPAAEQVRELRELIAVAEMKVEGIERITARELKLA